MKGEGADRGVSLSWLRHLETPEMVGTAPPLSHSPAAEGMRHCRPPWCRAELGCGLGGELMASAAASVSCLAVGTPAWHRPWPPHTDEHRLSAPRLREKRGQCAQGTAEACVGLGRRGKAVLRGPLLQDPFWMGSDLQALRQVGWGHPQTPGESQGHLERSIPGAALQQPLPPSLL